MNQDRIILEGMEFYAYHGAMPEENRLGQRFVVDLILTLDLTMRPLVCHLMYGLRSQAHL